MIKRRLRIFKDFAARAWQMIRTQKLRTGITLMIIAIGILSLVGTLTVVEALNHTFTGNFEAIGVNSFYVRRYNNSLVPGRRRGHWFNRRPNPPIYYREVRQFRKKYRFPGTESSAYFTYSSIAQITAGEKETGENVEIRGVDDTYLKVFDYKLAQGRGFSAGDITNSHRVAVIGPQVAENLFGTQNPIGQSISYKGHRWQVIGVTRSKGSAFGRSEDNFVLIPLSVARGLMAVSPHFQIRVNVKDPEQYGSAMDRARMVMRSIRKLKPAQPDNFGIVGSEEALQELKQTTSILRAAAFVIGLITILASSIALMNIMLVTVTERIREIGILKAVGASARHIRWQFFIETLMIAFLGAFLGIMGGIGIGALTARLMKIDFTMPWNAVFWAIVITFVTAMISGFYPAVKASRANPIEALRYE